MQFPKISATGVDDIPVDDHKEHHKPDDHQWQKHCDADGSKKGLKPLQYWHCVHFGTNIHIISFLLQLDFRSRVKYQLVPEGTIWLPGLKVTHLT
jgi:hypothetical protein